MQFNFVFSQKYGNILLPILKGLAAQNLGQIQLPSFNEFVMA